MSSRPRARRVEGEGAEARRVLDDILDVLVNRFESGLVSGELEELAARLEAVIVADPSLGGVLEEVRLFREYVHALRVRVVGLGSRRGLSRARDELLALITGVGARLGSGGGLVSRPLRRRLV